MTQCATGLSRFYRWTVSACLFATCCVALAPSAADGSPLRMTPIVKAVKNAKPSVVNIRGEKMVDAGSTSIEQGDLGRRVNGMGTGVVIDPRGYILTNHHVVDGVREIQVTLADEERRIAKLIARDSETDLAIIKIDAPTDLKVLTVGRSSDLMTGEPVIAVGNAYGYEHTVTRGIISSLHRAVQVSDAQFYSDLIQTDASINPGNSGGPLLNIDGQMIGINVAVRAGAQGIGFAIPIDKAMRVAGELLAERNVKVTRHGLVLKTNAKPEGKGLVVASVAKDSPAADAGVKPGDVITDVDDVELARPLDFQRALLERQAGQKLEVAIHRDDEPMTLNLTLATASKSGGKFEAAAWDRLGLRLERIPAEQFRGKYKAHARSGSVVYRGGLAVTSVRPGGPAATQGIRAGDVLVGMHVWETVSMENVSYILNRPDLGADGPVKFYILRGKETLYGFMSLAMKIKTAQR